MSPICIVEQRRLLGSVADLDAENQCLSTRQQIFVYTTRCIACKASHLRRHATRATDPMPTNLPLLPDATQKKHYTSPLTPHFHRRSSQTWYNCGPSRHTPDHTTTHHLSSPVRSSRTRFQHLASQPASQPAYTPSIPRGRRYQAYSPSLLRGAMYLVPLRTRSSPARTAITCSHGRMGQDEPSPTQV